MVCQRYYCPSSFYTSYSITGPLDRVRLSASSIIIRVIIFDNTQDQEKIKFTRMTHTYFETDLIAMRKKN
jgi:hypothetical protein